MAPATLIQAQRSAGGQPHRATSIERPRRYAKIVNLHDHDLRAGGKVAVCFNRCELIELSHITACTDRAVQSIGRRSDMQVIYDKFHDLSYIILMQRLGRNQQQR